jgi:hypothetical protein
MMRTLILTLLIAGFSLPAFAQTKYTVSGAIHTKKSGENIVRATVLVSGQNIAAVSNEYGFFSLTLPAGSYRLIISTVGMQTQTVTVELTKNTALAISMEEGVGELKEAVVTAGNNDHKLSGTQMGTDRLSMTTIRDVPVFLGETDVLKTIQLLPGVASGGDGSTGFSVRGGAPDQNLVLLDGATVYNPSHMLGFFSTFNSDAVRDVTMYKAAMPPSYGGRLSSIVDVRMNEGNNQEYHGDVGVGAITMYGEVEGPIEKGGSSFLVAARTTRINEVLALSGDTSINKDKIGFYDLNGKFNFALGSKNHLYLSGYLGQDNLLAYHVFGLKYGNTVGALRWNHIFGARLFTNTSVSISNYDSWITGYVNNNSDYQVKSALNDVAFKQEWEWYAGPHTIKWGVNSVYHVLRPAKLIAGEGTGLNDTSYEARYGWENAIFAGDDWKVTDRFTLSYGIRLTDFQVYGPGNFYRVDAAGNVTDTMHYRNGQQVVNYLNPEPRLGLGYQLDSRSSVKASYTRNVQNMHLLANSPISLPADRWDLTNNNIKPEISDQLSVGYYREADDGVYSWSVETYYKTLQHQIDYRTGANIELTDIVETELLYGKGRAYGVEGQLKKNKGKLTGWISYTLSRSELLVGGINDNHWYDAPQDRTHNVAIVGIYHPNDKWTFSADWVYYTGNPVSYPSGKYQADGRIAYYYSQRNGYRMPPYDRLDLSVTRHIKKKHDQRELSFGVYNAYDRLNAFVINFRQDPDNPNETQAVKTALFGIVPYISYSIKF